MVTQTRTQARTRTDISTASLSQSSATITQRSSPQSSALNDRTSRTLECLRLSEYVQSDFGLSDLDISNVFKGAAMWEHRTLKKNGVFWDVPPCGSCKNGRFGGT
jgi:hypothetical protein